MADNEVSKVMWIAIVVALAATIFAIAKPQINTLTQGVFDNVGQVVNGIDSGSDSKNEESPVNLMPNASWNSGQGNWKLGFPDSFEILDPEADDPNNHILHGKPTKSQYQQTSQDPNPIRVEAGETYTLSFDFKDKNFTADFNTMILRVFDYEKPEDAEGYDAKTGKVKGGDATSQSNANWYKNLSTKDLGMSGGVSEFKRFSYTFTPSKSGWLNVIPYDSDVTGKHESFWRKLQVEKGSTATDWKDSK